jgi:predicted AlkP superfamily pyrophosphatase or phosphodiesterase
MQKTLLLAIWFIVIIKILFIICEAVYLFEERRKINSDGINRWKHKFEWIFNILISLVLIHIFYPRKNDMRNLTVEMRNLIFVYAILSLFSLLWTNIL